MAKELPYFKFEPNQWENGNIQMLSRDDKGLFIDLCSMYWSRLGDVPLKLAVQKLCAGNANALNSLCDNRIIAIEDDFIRIDFLEEQLSEFDNISKQNSKNAKDGWDKRRKINDLSERNATALISQCENDAIREDKIREDKNNISLSLENDFLKFWNIYNKKNDSKRCKDKFIKLPKKDIDKILEVVNDYVVLTPDVKFRKNPLTWLNGKCWNDIEKTEYCPTPDKPFGKTNQI
jgi:hypothetical protein